MAKGRDTVFARARKQNCAKREMKSFRTDIPVQAASSSSSTTERTEINFKKGSGFGEEEFPRHEAEPFSVDEIRAGGGLVTELIGAVRKRAIICKPSRGPLQ